MVDAISAAPPNALPTIKTTPKHRFRVTKCDLARRIDRTPGRLFSGLAMNRQSHRDWVLEALEEHEVALTRYALRLLRELEQARDVVQHAFLKLCEQAPEKIAGGERKWL